MANDSTMRDRRDAEIDRQTSKRRPTLIPSPFEAKVVGVSFVPAYPDNLHDLAANQERAQAVGEPLTVILIRNPDNAYDSNAIEVHIPALGSQAFIGHLTRPIALRLAPEIDADVRWAAEIISVLIDPDHMDRPGISIRCARVPEEEQTNGE